MTPNQILAKYRLRKLMRIRDEATGMTKEVIDFIRTDGTRGRLELAPSIFLEKREATKKLIDAGADLPFDGSERATLMLALAAATPTKHQTLLAHAGWSPDRKWFAVGKHIVGDASVGAVAPGAAGGKNAGIALRLTVTGSAKEWTQNIGEIGLHSSLITFLISTVFAAPLLRPLEIGTVVFVISGRTRIGKSLSTLTAASAIGYQHVKDMPTWSITDASLEQQLPAMSDVMVPFDDISTMMGNPKQKFARLEGIAYRASSGREMERHTNFQAEAREWVCLIVTQAEQAISEMAREIGRDRRGGATLRMIDIPAMDENDEDIFDLRVQRTGRKNSSEWRSRTFDTIVRESKAHSGQAFIDYMEKLIAEGENAIHRAGKSIDYFVEKVTDDLDGDEARDLARKFGAVYAGAKMAMAYGILDWDQEHAFKAASRCYCRARALLRDESQILKEGISRLKAVLRSLPLIRVDKAKPLKSIPDEGFRHQDGEFRRYVVKVEVFIKAFESAEQRGLVEKWALEEGWLTRAIKKTGGPAEPKGQVKWPDGTRHRSYEFKVPRKPTT